MHQGRAPDYLSRVLRRTEISKGWEFADGSWLEAPGYLACSRLEWLPAEVPGAVHLDLVRNRVLAHPFEGLGELGCQWVDLSHWLYRVRFDYAPAAQLPHRCLRFEGLDTVCEVFVNGTHVATHDNMFVPLEVALDDLAVVGSNTIEVRFRSAVEVGRQRRDAYFATEGLPSDLVRFEERAFVRKAAYMFGWDWGPRLVSAGIWKPVALLEYQSRILDVHIEQEHRSDGRVAVRCRTDIEGEGVAVHFWRSADTETWRRFGDDEELVLEGPALWWPVSMGAPNLNELRSFVLSRERAAMLPSLEECEAECFDQRSNRVGLRVLELEQEPDAWGRSFCFKVNGRRVWCVGANWIPEHSFPSEATRQRLTGQLRRAVDMNMNMLRVWGGGVYESDEFYDLCDELGLLVWQDFPFACSYSPDNEDAQDAIEREVVSAVRRLRNHPSLAIWCGNNENLMMFEAKWDDATKHPPRCHGEKIWEVTLPGLLQQLDPSRPYLSTSPHSPNPGELANSDVCGDQHNWDVWHGRGDWRHYQQSRARFASEYGFAAGPSSAAWSVALGHSDLTAVDVRDRVVRWHDKTKKGYETFIGFVELHYAKASNLREWSYFSQLNQRDALTAAIEHYRSSEFCSGSLIWQMNDCWPVQSWSVLDCTGAYKAAAYMLRRLYAPAVASARLTSDGHTCEFVVALDNVLEGRTERLIVEARDSLTGELLQRWETQIGLLPGQRRGVLTVDTARFVRNQTVLWYEFAGYRAFKLLVEPKDLLTALPSWRIVREDSRLELTTEAPVFDLWIDAPGAAVSDNFLSLPQPGTLRVAVTGICDEVHLSWLGGYVRLGL